MADDEIRFSRSPYTVTYLDLQGKQQTLRRVPPPKLHEMLPTDIVELTTRKNEDFETGDLADVYHINVRHPNVLQLRNDDGLTTFVEYFDVDLHEEVAPRPGRDPRDLPDNNRYLIWP